MKKILSLLIISSSMNFMVTSYGQVAATVTEITLEKPNIIKFNLTGPIVGYYTLSYERVIKLKQSVGLTMSIAPNIDLPFKSTLINIFGDNEEAVTAINSTTFTSFSIMPEYRFYTGSLGAPFGFYFTTFLKYTHMSHEQVYEFTTNNDVVHNPLIKTTFNGFGIGEMIGVQWRLGNSMTVDWWILGPYIGFLNGSSHGTDDMSDLNADDKADLEADIESVPIPTWNIEATVGDDVIDAEFKGLFYGTRIFGVNLGYRF